MRVVLLSFPGWLCLLCAPARSGSTASARSTANSSKSTIRPNPEETQTEMASTALDFREMMRKERERAMKKRATAASAYKASSSKHLSHRRTPLDLERNHRVAPPAAGGRGVDGIYYVPGFVTKEEGKLLENAARAAGDGGDGGGGAPEWKELYNRRLQIHGGTPHPSGMVEEELPPFLREVCDALVEAGIFPERSPPNHVLLNEYSSGQGIGPHKDGPLYEGRVAILSLGKEASLDFWGSLEDAKADCAAVAAAAAAAGSSEGTPAEGNSGGTETDECWGPQKAAGAEATAAAAATARKALASVRCEDCSLVVFEGPAYHDAWHGIASTAGAGDAATSAGGGDAPATAQAAAAAAPAEAAAGEAAGRKGGSKSGQDTTAATAASPPAQASGEAATPSYSSGDGSVSGRDAVRGGEEGAARKRLSFTIRRVARVVPAESVMEHPEARSEMERRRRGFERSVTETGVIAAPRVR